MRQNVQCFAGVSMQVKDTAGLKTVPINEFLHFYHFISKNVRVRIH